MVSRRFIAALTLALASGATFSHASTEQHFVSGPGSWLSTYLPAPLIVTTVGGEVTYTNFDVQPHDVVSYDRRAANDQPAWCDQVNAFPCPLFGSSLVFLGQSAPVYGLEDILPLKPYEFYCSIHPGMEGVLVAAA